MKAVNTVNVWKTKTGRGAMNAVIGDC